ncbi:MAG: DUF255 domain-containing protein [Planctomyces sp.]|nr:DUF255 domain-containing protein [Planctomyces sp.]
MCLLTTQLFAQEVQWSHDIDDALKQSAATGKPVLMEFTAKWCAFCRKMEVTTFADPEVATHIHQNFIPVQVDADQHKDLVKQLQIKGLPAILIVGSDLAIVERISGYQTADAMLDRLEKVAPEAKSPTKKTPASTVATAETTTKRKTAAVNAATASYPAEENPFAPPAAADVAPKTNTENPFAAFEELESEPAAPSDENPFGDPSPIRAASQSRPGKPEVVAEEPATETTEPEESAAEVKVEFGGLCLVSAVEERALTEGLPEFQTVYHGKKIQFCSEDHMQKFLSNPERYWPMLDGACAVTLAEDGKTVTGELRYASVFRKRVWLFSSDKKLKTFIASPADIVEEALEEQ